MRSDETVITPVHPHPWPVGPYSGTRLRRQLAETSKFYTLLSSVISPLKMYCKERIQKKGKVPHRKTPMAGLLIIVETMEII